MFVGKMRVCTYPFLQHALYDMQSVALNANEGAVRGARSLARSSDRQLLIASESEKAHPR